MDLFREYKNFKPRWKPKKRIPVVRSLFVLVLLYAVYASGTVQIAYRFIEEQRSVPETQPSYADMAWNEGCEMTHGKAFDLKKKYLGQCSWILNSLRDVAVLPENSFVRYVASVPGALYPLRVHWLADTSNFWKPKIVGVQTGMSTVWYFHLMTADSSYSWVRSNGCRYPGECPRNPLLGGALPILADFDFGGREDLLLKDLFMGIGEAPVYPILSARILSVSKDSLGYKIFLDHDGNLFSRVSGLSQLAPGVEVGKNVSVDDPIGRISPNDSAVFFLEVLRNGRFVRWDNFYKSSHVVDASDVERFRSEMGF